jgi:hypothetical protein
MANTYRYLFADLLTNDIIAELPLTGVQFTQQLNQAGTFEGHLLITGIDTNAYNVDVSTIPCRNVIYVEADGILIWGGIIWGRSYNSTSQVLSITAREFESYFEHRRITQDTFFTNTDQLLIAETLLSNAQSVTYGDIGVLINSQLSGILISRNYYSYELKTVFNALQDLSRAEDGFDFNITLSYSSGTPIKTLELGYPRIGVVYNSANPYAIMFDLPGNIVEYEYPEDGSIVANTMYALGAGSNEGKLISTAVNTAFTSTGWPLLEETANYSDVTDQTYLDQLAIGQVNAVSYPPTTLKVVVPADVEPKLTTYNIGDDARIVITDARFPNTLDEIYRIVGLTVQPGENGPERVTITLTTTTN